MKLTSSRSKDFGFVHRLEQGLAEAGHFGQRLAKGLVDWLVASDEPQVHQKIDRHGNSVEWDVYDPMTGHSGHFASDLEVRLWLEKSLYH